MPPRNTPMLALQLALLLAALAAHAAGQNPRSWDPRFRDQGDGTVLATRVGLVWLADANCWKPMPWEEAQAAAARLQDGMCGLSDGSKPGDWRLPTQLEWTTMVDCTCADIVISDDTGTGCYASGHSAFHSVQPKEYWSSTESTGGGGRIVAMSLFDGFERAAAAKAPLHVWPVRASVSKSPQDDGG